MKPIFLRRVSLKGETPAAPLRESDESTVRDALARWLFVMAWADRVESDGGRLGSGDIDEKAPTKVPASATTKADLTLRAFLRNIAAKHGTKSVEEVLAEFGDGLDAEDFGHQLAHHALGTGAGDLSAELRKFVPYIHYGGHDLDTADLGKEYGFYVSSDDEDETEESVSEELKNSHTNPKSNWTPTLARLKSQLKLDDAKAKAVLAAIRKHPNDGSSGLEVIDKILGTYGVEAIQGEGLNIDHAEAPREYGSSIGAAMIYCNNGDTYKPTVCYDEAENEYLVCGWGDWVEWVEGEYPVPSQDEAKGVTEVQLGPVSGIDDLFGKKFPALPGQVYGDESAAEFGSVLQAGIKAPYVRYTPMVLQGVSVFLSVSLDPKESWSNGIFENSRHLKISIRRDGTMTALMKHYTMPTFRKTRVKSAEEAVQKINRYIASVDTAESESIEEEGSFSTRSAQDFRVLYDRVRSIWTLDPAPMVKAGMERKVVEVKARLKAAKFAAAADEVERIAKEGGSWDMAAKAVERLVGGVKLKTEDVDESARRYVMHDGIRKRVLSKSEWAAIHKDYKGTHYDEEVGKRVRSAMLGAGDPDGNGLMPVYVDGLDKGGEPIKESSDGMTTYRGLKLKGLRLNTSLVGIDNATGKEFWKGGLLGFIEGNRDAEVPDKQIQKWLDKLYTTREADTGERTFRVVSNAQPSPTPADEATATLGDIAVADGSARVAFDSLSAARQFAAAADRISKITANEPEEVEDEDDGDTTYAVALEWTPEGAEAAVRALKLLVTRCHGDVMVEAAVVEGLAERDDDDEAASEEFDEPTEGDITTEDHRRWYRYGKLYVTGDEKAVVQKMEADQFWPNIWFISDHGNAHLITAEVMKRGRLGKLLHKKNKKTSESIEETDLRDPRSWDGRGLLGKKPGPVRMPRRTGLDLDAGKIARDNPTAQMYVRWEKDGKTERKEMPAAQAQAFARKLMADGATVQEVGVVESALPHPLAAFGINPDGSLMTFEPKKYECPSCHEHNATWETSHEDTDMEELNLHCPDCKKYHSEDEVPKIVKESTSPESDVLRVFAPYLLERAQPLNEDEDPTTGGREVVEIAQIRSWLPNPSPNVAGQNDWLTYRVYDDGSVMRERFDSARGTTVRALAAAIPSSSLARVLSELKTTLKSFVGTGRRGEVTVTVNENAPGSEPLSRPVQRGREGSIKDVQGSDEVDAKPDLPAAVRIRMKAHEADQFFELADRYRLDPTAVTVGVSDGGFLVTIPPEEVAKLPAGVLG